MDFKFYFRNKKKNGWNISAQGNLSFNRISRKEFAIYVNIKRRTSISAFDGKSK